jgi:hypothetical protein
MKIPVLASMVAVLSLSANGAMAQEKTETATPKVVAAPPKADSTDVSEDPMKRYYFIGLRYRGNIVPQFLTKLFVDEGATIYSNTIGIEADIRKDGFSIIPALSYTEYGTQDILFKEKNKPDIPGNWSMVNSGMKALYLTADLLWSSKVHKNVDIEYGFGAGFGFIFGDLVTNWVRQDPNGPLTDSTGRKWTPCNAGDENQTSQAYEGCRPQDHQNKTPAKTGRYVEPSWFDGGSRPNLFPWLALPQLGVRIKPVKEFQARIGLGFALTGFFFNLSVNYGLENHIDAPKKTGGPTIHWGGAR